MIPTLLSLLLVFSQLSLLAFGGGVSILPEMQRQVVEVYHWMSAQEFNAMFALAQASPGPNMMVVTLVGWHVAGWQGVLATTLAKFGPSSVVTCAFMGVWERFKDKPWRRLIQAGVVPVTVGLVAASATIITVESARTWMLGLITAVGAVVLVRFKVHPLWILAAGALVGLTGIGQ